MRSVFRQQSRKARAAFCAVDRVWPDIEKMESVSNGAVKSSFRNLNEREIHLLKRYTQHKIAQSKVFSTQSKKLTVGCSDAEKQEKLDALMRIPTEDFVRIRKIEDVEKRLKALADLIDEHYVSGNRCNHNKLSFANDGGFSPYDTNQRYLKNGKKRKPEIIYTVSDHLILAVLFPEEHGFKKLFFKKTSYYVKRWKANHRQRRTDGRESMLKTMLVLLQFWDPRSMRCGYRDDLGKFTGVTIAKIAELSGLSHSRVTNGLRLLEEQDFLFEGKQRKEVNGQTGEFIKGHPVVRVIKRSLFTLLCLDKRILKERYERSVPVSSDRLPENQQSVDSNCSNMRTMKDITSAFLSD